MMIFVIDVIVTQFYFQIAVFNASLASFDTNNVASCLFLFNVDGVDMIFWWFGKARFQSVGQWTKSKTIFFVQVLNQEDFRSPLASIAVRSHAVQTSVNLDTLMAVWTYTSFSHAHWEDISFKSEDTEVVLGMQRVFVQCSWRCHYKLLRF